MKRLTRLVSHLQFMSKMVRDCMERVSSTWSVGVCRVDGEAMGRVALLLTAEWPVS